MLAYACNKRKDKLPRNEHPAQAGQKHPGNLNLCTGATYRKNQTWRRSLPIKPFKNLTERGIVETFDFLPNIGCLLCHPLAPLGGQRAGEIEPPGTRAEVEELLLFAIYFFGQLEGI